MLVDESGRMSRANETAAPSAARLRAVYHELCAQVERLALLGVHISHVDSHNHAHTRPFLFPVLKALQRRYGIRRVRLSKTFYAPDRPCPPALLWRKRAFNAALRSIYATRTTDDFTEFLTYCRADEKRRPLTGTIELMVHPGAPSAGEETAMLESDWMRRIGRLARLISYAELA